MCDKCKKIQEINYKENEGYNEPCPNCGNLLKYIKKQCFKDEGIEAAEEEIRFYGNIAPLIKAIKELTIEISNLQLELRKKWMNSYIKEEKERESSHNHWVLNGAKLIN